MSILNSQDKADLQNAFDEAIVETFERDIVVYRDADKVTVNTSPNDNPLFRGSPHNANIEKEINEQTIKARIYWGRKHTLQELSGFGSDSSTKTLLQDGEVQIKVRKEHDALFQGVKFAAIDGIEVVPETSKRPHGLFDHAYSTFLFNKTN